MAILQSCLEDKRSIDWKSKFLSKDDALLVSDITNVLIPDQDIPDSVKNLIPKYIDVVLLDYSSQEEQDNFLNGIKDFGLRCKNDTGSTFMDCNNDQIITFLKKEEEDFVGSEQPTFYGTLKQLIFESFFQTEHGVQLLDFNPLPGGFSGCVPLSDLENIQFNYATFKL
jgi:hypothetical protein